MRVKLFVTNACNLNCTYCYEQSKRNKSKMTKEIGETAIKFFLSRIIPDEVVDLSFHGGEPLLDFELIKYLTEYFKTNISTIPNKYKFSITTNGTLITDEIASYLKNNKFSIKLSLDGIEDSNNIHRKSNQNEPVYQKVINAAHILKNNECEFSIRMTVTPQNINYLTQSVKSLSEQGYTRFNIVANAFDDWSNSYNELEAAFNNLKELYLGNISKKRLSIDIFDGKIVSYLLGNEPLLCNAGIRSYSVSTSGKLYPCTYVIDESEFCFGDVSSGIYVNDRKECIKKHISKGNICKDCNINRFCSGVKCGYLNYATTGYLNTPSEFLCKHEKLLHRLNGEIIKKLYLQNDPKLIGILKYLQNSYKYSLSDTIEKLNV